MCRSRISCIRMGALRMTRNIMTGEGIKPVEAVTEFEVSGIKMFTHIDDWGHWCATEASSGFALTHDITEPRVIEAAKAKIANVGPEKVMERVRATIALTGVANEEAKA